MEDSTPIQPAPKFIARQAETNEWGQITGLEAKAPYLVIRKPTPEFARERSKELVEQARAFLHEHRVLTEQQMKELNEKYGEPAKARVNELRSVLEKRFDEMSREIEQRVSKLEGELSDRGLDLRGRRTQASAAPAAPGAAGETPGEMPTGGNGGSAASPAASSAASEPASKKRPARKGE
jgi:hypothetical protein